jgi:hypothetical protein
MQKPTILRLLLVCNGERYSDIGKRIGASAVSISRTAKGLDRGRTLRKLAEDFNYPAEGLCKRVTASAVKVLGDHIK